jgi:LAGLIDADG-like domain
MVGYRKARDLSREVAAYIAGLIDGEGTLSLTRRHRGENRQFVISISNTEARLLNYVCRAVGAGRITRKRTSKSNHTPSGTYTIDNRQALDLLQQITP